jgi:hypothetical protein
VLRHCEGFHSLPGISTILYLFIYCLLKDPVSSSHSACAAPT